MEELLKETILKAFEIAEEINAQEILETYELRDYNLYIADSDEEADLRDLDFMLDIIKDKIK